MFYWYMYYFERILYSISLLILAASIFHIFLYLHKRKKRTETYLKKHPKKYTFDIFDFSEAKENGMTFFKVIFKNITRFFGFM